MISRTTVPALMLVLAAACGGAQDESAAPGDPLDSVSGEVLYERGVLLANAGDYIRAEQYLAASMERGFPEERAIPALMHVCVQADRLVAALTYAEPYLERHPEEWSLRMLVASIHMGLAHDDEARELFERVVRDAPEQAAQAHYFLGVLHRDRLDDLERARAHFARYLALEPEGEHREEARAAVAHDGRVPVRVPMPADDETPADTAAPDDVAEDAETPEASEQQP